MACILKTMSLEVLNLVVNPMERQVPKQALMVMVFKVVIASQAAMMPVLDIMSNKRLKFL